jgi:hypothetical protein
MINPVFRRIKKSERVIDPEWIERLAYYRFENRLMLKDMSKILGIHNTRLSGLYNGKVAPTEMEKYHINQFLDKWYKKHKQNEID